MAFPIPCSPQEPISALQQENQALQAEITHLKHLLTLSTSSAAATSQHHRTTPPKTEPSCRDSSSSSSTRGFSTRQEHHTSASAFTLNPLDHVHPGSVPEGKQQSHGSLSSRGEPYQANCTCSSIAAHLNNTAGRSKALIAQLQRQVLLLEVRPYRQMSATITYISCCLQSCLCIQSGDQWVLLAARPCYGSFSSHYQMCFMWFLHAGIAHLCMTRTL
jgi:hypothetical protein